MIKPSSRVRHKDEAINQLRGVMKVLSIKHGIVTCTYSDLERYGTEEWTYYLNELELA